MKAQLSLEVNGDGELRLRHLAASGDAEAFGQALDSHRRRRALTGHGVCMTDPQERRSIVLTWAIVFFVIAIIAAVLGFGGIAASAAGIAKVLFVIFLVLAVVAAIAQAVRGRPPV